MNKVKFSTIAAIAAIALSLLTMSCKKNDEPEMDSKVELRLASGVEGQTAQLRSTFTGTDTQIPGGQTIAVWVDETGSAQMYGNNVLTANGSGGFSGGAPMFFPQSGNGVDIYAIQTNATLTSAYPATALTHTVGANQTALTGYAPSDLLYANLTNVARTTSAVQLTFYHLLSKLQVAIVPGDGLAASDITGVTVGGTQLAANFTLAKSTASNAVAITTSGSAADITISADVSANFTNPAYNDLIIVPQTLSAGTAFITVHLASGSDLVYYLPADATFESSKKYQYHITANLTGISLTSTITNWTPVNPINGTAEM